jgi:hypothetical protein
MSEPSETFVKGHDVIRKCSMLYQPEGPGNKGFRRCRF